MARPVAGTAVRRPARLRRPQPAARDGSGPRPDPGTPHPRILALQQTAGNQATTAIVQRQGVAPDGTISDPELLERLRPVGGAVDVETRVRVVEALLSTPRSRRTLDAIERARGDLHFPIKWSARGNFHRRGAIHLDRTGNEADWLRSMAHELVHLQTFLEGRAPDVASTSRDEFVEAKMTDEINAQAAAYLSLLQLGITSSRSRGYNDFRAFLRSRHRALLEAENWDAIERRAKVWLEDKYRNEFTTGGKNYYDYWGEVWDNAHAD